MFQVPNHLRIKDHMFLASTDADGNNGAFEIKLTKTVTAIVIASDGAGWEHVSAHIVETSGLAKHERGVQRTPTWDEMCKIKDMFWGEQDCVIQFHPPRSQYVNRHPYTLHLWRPIGIELPLPKMILVG